MDEEKLISDAFHQAFKKTAKIPSDLYLRMHHELKIDDNEPLKVNLTMKRGLVVDIEDDSLFRTFLTVGDIVLTINDRVASKSDFKLTETLKDKKTITFNYIRLRNYAPEEPHFEEGDKRENFDYKIAVIYCLQRMVLGITVEGLNNRVYITKIQPKSLGSLCAAAGDVILQVNGKRVCDTEKAMSLIMDELESKSHFKITLERAKSEEARALVQYAISKEHRDPPVPADCAEYIEKALAAMKSHHEPKSILKSRSLLVAAEANSSVAFHERITTENVIPSDIADEALIKTPARVPNSPAQSQPSSAQPVSSENADRAETSVSKQISMHEGDKKTGHSKEAKSTTRWVLGKKGKSKKASDGAGSGGSGTAGKSKESVGGSPTSVMGQASTMTATSPLSPKSPKKSFREWRKRLSTEIFFGRNRKKSGGSGTLEAAKKMKNKKKKDHTNTASNDTEGNQ